MRDHDRPERAHTASPPARASLSVARNGQPRPAAAARSKLSATVLRRAQRSRNLPVADAAVLQAQDLAYASHRHSLGWHRSPRSLSLTSRAPGTAQRSSAATPSGGGRSQIGMAEIKSELVADFPRNTQAAGTGPQDRPQIH